MKKESLFRGLTIGIACSMLCLSACGNKKTDETVVSTDVAATEVDRDHIYNLEDIELPVEGKYITNAMSKGKDYFFMVANLFETELPETKLFKIDLKTGEITEVPFELEYNLEVNRLVCDTKDNVYIIKSADTDSESEEAVEGTKEATEESEENEGSIDNEEADEKQNASIMKLSPDGTKIWEAPLTEEDTKEYIQSVAYQKDKGILTCAQGNISLYDENTGEGKVIAQREENGDYYYGLLFNSKDGDAYLSDDDWDGGDSYSIKKFNPTTMTFDEEIPLPKDVYVNYVYPGETYDFYYEDFNKIQAFNLGDAEPTLICDYTSSDILSNYMGYICETPDGKFYVIDHDDNGSSILGCMTKVNPSDIQEKETITLGVVYIPNNVREQVVRFNKKSDKYKIKIVDYGDSLAEDTEDAYTETLKRIGLDLVQGTGPDIIVIDSEMPLESYVEKGALEPLDSYFENDSEFNSKDFLPNVLDSTKIGGNMYTLLPVFGIETCVASKDVVGDQTVTLANYEDICKSNNMDPRFGMGYMSREMANSLYSTIGSTFVDYENETCNFDSEDFVNFLEFVKLFPKTVEETGLEYEDFETYYRDKKSLLCEYYISSFEDYQVLKKAYFGSDVEFNGLPAGDGGKSFIYPVVQLAMNHDSKYKDAAWEFMRSFMLDDYQNNLEWGLPIKQSAFDALAKKAQEKPYYIDEKGKKVESYNIWNIGGEDVEITELSSEEAQQLVDFVKSVSNSMSFEQKVNDIIAEEAGAFYEGQKSAEEVADIIQNRVSLYLSENG